LSCCNNSNRNNKNNKNNKNSNSNSSSSQGGAATRSLAFPVLKLHNNSNSNHSFVFLSIYLSNIPSIEEFDCCVSYPL